MALQVSESIVVRMDRSAVAAGLAVPLLLALSAGSAFAANEWSHGRVADAMGFGHHHVADWGDAYAHACPHAGAGNGWNATNGTNSASACANGAHAAGHGGMHGA